MLIKKKIVLDFRFSISDALLTFKQQLTDITKSCGKVAPSDGDKQNRKMLTKIVLVWVDKQTIKKFREISIPNQFTRQKDKERLSIEEVSVNENATYDIPPFNPNQNLNCFSELTPFQSSETYISMTENKSEPGEVTITKLIGNSNETKKKTGSSKLSPSK